MALLGISLALAACGPVPPSGPPVAVTPASPSAGATAATTPSATPRASPSASASTIRIRVARSDLRLPAARSRSVALLFGSTILLCGGLTSKGATTASIAQIDLSSRLVSVVGALAQPVHDAGGAVLDGTGFVLGGGNVVAGPAVQQVGPTAATALIGHLPAVRADLAAVTVGSEIVVVGGGTPARPDSRVLATKDGVVFAVVAKLLVGVRYPAVAVVGRLVYVIGGSTPSGDSRAIQTLDPRTGIVRIVGHLPHGLSHASALVLNGVILIAGGRSAGRAQDAVWQLDLSTGAVTRIGRLPYAVSDAAAVVVDGTGYLIGGEGSAPLASIVTVTIR